MEDLELVWAREKNGGPGFIPVSMSVAAFSVPVLEEPHRESGWECALLEPYATATADYAVRRSDVD